MTDRHIPRDANKARYIEDGQPPIEYIHYVWQEGARAKEAWERGGTLLEKAGLAPSAERAGEYTHIAKNESIDEFFRTLKCLKNETNATANPVLVWLNHKSLKVSEPLTKEPTAQ